MQLNEKRKNVERERNFDRLLTELDYKINENKQASLLNSDYSYSVNKPSKQQQTNYAFTPSYSEHQPIDLSYSSSYTSSSSDGNQKTYSYSSNSKSSGLDRNHQNVVFSSNQGDPNSYLSIQSPTPILAKTGKTVVDDQEANSLIFRVPESSSLRSIQCLSKWFDDLGKEDAEWIRRSQLKNEKLFDEIVKLQKAQWDNLRVEHDMKKDQHLPKTFKCDLKNKELCDQEEANFNKMFNEYRVEKYPPTKSDQQSNQYQSNQYQSNQQNYYPQVYNQVDTYQSQQQRQPLINNPNQRIQ